MVAITRRDFIKGAGVAAAAVAGGGLTIGESFREYREKKEKEKIRSTICGGCGLGCGVETVVEKTVPRTLRGLSSQAVNQGSMCSTGLSLMDEIDSSLHIKGIQYSRAGSSQWTTISREKAASLIARKIKEIRDRTFVIERNNSRLNRSEAFAGTVAATLKNEDLYAWKKFSLFTGIAPEHQYRKETDHRSLSAMERCTGLPLSTNSIEDSRDSDVILVMNSRTIMDNGVAASYCTRARERGAEVVLVDSFLSSVAPVASKKAVIAQGTEKAFINGIIAYALSKKRINREYIKNHTTAGYLIHEDYSFSQGLFSGYSRNGNHNTVTWSYQINRKGEPKIDRGLDNRYSVFWKMKQFFSRYTPEVVEKITGLQADQFKEIADVVTSTWSKGALSVMVHVENDFTDSLMTLQGLLGNIGIKGGGIHLLGMESNEQGYNDFSCGSIRLPGNIHYPQFGRKAGLDRYYTSNVGTSYILKEEGRRMTAFLKRQFASEYKGAFDWIAREGSSLARPSARFVLGQDRYSKSIDIRGLELLVFMNSYLPDFIKKANTRKSDAFIIPASQWYQYSGSVTSQSRKVEQVRAIAPPDSAAQTYAAFLYEVFAKLKKLYQVEGGVFPEPIIHGQWKSGMAGDLFREITGKESGTNRTGSSGNWLYGKYAGQGWSLPYGSTVLFNRASLSPHGEEIKEGRSDVPADNAESSPDSWGRTVSFPEVEEGVLRFFHAEGSDGPLPEFRVKDGEPLEEYLLRMEKSSMEFHGAVDLTGQFLPSRVKELDLALYREAVVKNHLVVSPQFAKMKGITHGSQVTVQRGGYKEALRAVISYKAIPLKIHGKKYHTVIFHVNLGSMLAERLREESEETITIMPEDRA